MSSDLIYLLAFAALFSFGWLIQYVAKLHRQLDEANHLIEIQFDLVRFLYAQNSGGAFAEFINSLDFDRLEHKQ